MNRQAPSQRPPSFEWHLRVQAEITSPATKLTWTSFPYQMCSAAIQRTSLCMCAFRSHFCIVSVVWCVRGTRAHSGESIWDIYYALHQSFWTLDISLAEQIVSYQNSISEMTCWNSLPSPSEPLLHSCSLFPPSLHSPAHMVIIIVCMYTHFEHLRTNEVQPSSPTSPLHSVPPFSIA